MRNQKRRMNSVNEICVVFGTCPYNINFVHTNDSQFSNKAYLPSEFPGLVILQGLLVMPPLM